MLSSKANETNANDKISPYKLSIDNYIIPSLMPIDDKYKQAYNDLFNGKYDGIKDLICDNIEYINIGKVMDNFPDVTFETPESIRDYFNILVDGISTPDVTMPDSWEDKEWATDFTFSKYSGKNGNIIAVEYSYIIIDKTYKAINCYRDDDYSVCGVFDDDAELSSGDLALWVAENLQNIESQKDTIQFDDFQKMDIRVSTILAAEKVAKTKKLLKLTVDTGIDQRTIISGIAEYFTPEELIGRKALVLVNLAPRELKGIVSQGMILMAEDASGKLLLLGPNGNTNNGAIVG